MNGRRCEKLLANKKKGLDKGGAEEWEMTERQFVTVWFRIENSNAGKVMR